MRILFGSIAVALALSSPTSAQDVRRGAKVDLPVNHCDLHATLLHLLGLDHLKLTFRNAGRDFRLTDIAGQVVKGMDVVDQLTIHDVITRVRIWDGVLK